jgi:chromosomal replication initiator protein
MFKDNSTGSGPGTPTDARSTSAKFTQDIANDHDRLAIEMDSFQALLAKAMSPEQHKLWAGDLRVVSADAHIVVIGARNRLHADRIHDKVSPPRFSELWRQADPMGRRARLEALVTELVSPRALSSQPRVRDDGTFSFSNFVKGESNRVAYDVVRAMSCDAASPYRLAYLHGRFGTGKTHLLQAAALQEGALYFSADRFRSDYVGALRTREGLAFKERLRGANLLLVDDIHMLSNAKKTQGELYHAIVEVLTGGARVLLAGEAMPADLTALDNRLVERLSAGVICAMDIPDFEQREALVDHFFIRHAKEGEAIAVPICVRDQIAGGTAGFSPRQIEGVVANLIAHTVRIGEPLTFDAACKFVQNAHGSAAHQSWTVEAIQKVVARFHNLSVDELLSATRVKCIVRPRQQAMYFSKTLTNRSLPFISQRFRKKDHTTVLNALKKVQELTLKDPHFAREMVGLQEQFSRGPTLH